MPATISPPANPATTAREAIRRMAAARVVPTPDNFARAYREVSGNSDSAPDADFVVNRLVEKLIAGRTGSEQIDRFREKVKSRDWTGALAQVDGLVASLEIQQKNSWPQLLERLLALLDTRHPSWSRARKLAAIEHVLSVGAQSDEDRLFVRLENLVRSWTLGASANSGAIELVDVIDDVSVERASETKWKKVSLDLLEALFNSQPERETDLALLRDSRLNDEEQALHAARLLVTVREARHRNDVVQSHLHTMLKLTCDNLENMNAGEGWVDAHVSRLLAESDEPLDEQLIHEAEARWRVVMNRQSELRGKIDSAKGAMKEMLATLVDRLGLMVNATGDYYLRVEDHAVAIRGASAIDDLVSVVSGLLADTSAIQNSVQRSRGDLENARGKAEGLENRVHELEQELANISEMVRTDPLTKTLNRRGLDEMFVIEQARGKRDERPLCVAILDIDDFKKINDSRGHDTGDRALQHLTECMRSALRPTDIISRFGGEEFVLLLPATSSIEGAEVLVRLQRHLTKELFLHNQDRILITFSAGITEYRTGEEQDAAITRADQALYRAKAAGKNRVLIE